MATAVGIDLGTTNSVIATTPTLVVIDQLQVVTWPSGAAPAPVRRWVDHALAA
ncbi:hypothetical protein ACRYCC_15095 [Actinomadura scrupuli]|uniref:hypothetical protein n=1 Tax=Actinomadura scrupuli TaxID=559629 RepID=UPI003D99360A